MKKLVQEQPKLISELHQKMNDYLTSKKEELPTINPDFSEETDSEKKFF